MCCVQTLFAQPMPFFVVGVGEILGSIARDLVKHTMDTSSTCNVSPLSRFITTKNIEHHRYLYLRRRPRSARSPPQRRTKMNTIGIRDVARLRHRNRHCRGRLAVVSGKLYLLHCAAPVCNAQVRSNEWLLSTTWLAVAVKGEWQGTFFLLSSNLKPVVSARRLPMLFVCLG